MVVNGSLSPRPRSTAGAGAPSHLTGQRVAGVTIVTRHGGTGGCIGISILYPASRPNIATLGRVRGSDQYADIARHADNQPPAGVAVLRVEAGISFANADAVRARVVTAAAEPGVHAVVLDAETIPFVDVTAARMIAALADDLRRRDIDLLIARDIGHVRDLLDREAPDPALHRVYPTVQAAVDAAIAGHVPA